MYLEATQLQDACMNTTRPQSRAAEARKQKINDMKFCKKFTAEDMENHHWKFYTNKANASVKKSQHNSCKLRETSDQGYCKLG